MVETLAILSRRDPHHALECPTHGLRGPQTALRAYCLEAFRGFFEKATRGFDSRRRDEAGGSHSHLAREHAREVSGTHGNTACQRRNGEVLMRMVDDIGLEFLKRLALGHLNGELGAELGLPARTAEEYDQLPRDRERDFASV